MPKFTVHLEQYVQEVATIEVEADNIEAAISLAFEERHEADWCDGEGSRDMQAYRVENATGEVVWEYEI